MILSIVPLQSVVLEKLQIGGIKPDLALVWVFFQGWYFGALNGLYWGMALGSILDLFSVGTLGIGLITKSLVGTAAGLFGKSFLHLSLPLHVLIFILVSVVHDLSGNIFLHGFDRISIQSGLTEALARAVYNSLFGIGFILVARSNPSNRGEGIYGGTIFPS